MRIFRIFLIIFATSFFVSAQELVKPKLSLFDEFGKLSQKEIKLRTQKLREKLEETDSIKDGLGAYLIFYVDGKKESLAPEENTIIHVLYDNCRDCYGYGGARIIFIHVDNSKEVKIQFWLYPPGAEPPKLNNEGEVKN